MKVTKIRLTKTYRDELGGGGTRVAEERKTMKSTDYTV